jgi:membrane protease YdiL (CAAX protease family)
VASTSTASLSKRVKPALKRGKLRSIATRCEKVGLTGSWVAAILLSVVTFTFAHLSGWGVVHLIPVFGAAVVFALLYVWRRDTPSNIIAHFLTDGMGFLLS